MTVQERVTVNTVPQFSCPKIDHKNSTCNAEYEPRDDSNDKEKIHLSILGMDMNSSYEC